MKKRNNTNNLLLIMIVLTGIFVLLLFAAVMNRPPHYSDKPIQVELPGVREKISVQWEDVSCNNGKITASMTNNAKSSALTQDYFMIIEVTGKPSDLTGSSVTNDRAWVMPKSGIAPGAKNQLLLNFPTSGTRTGMQTMRIVTPEEQAVAVVMC
jgi:hypothetical protein